MNILFVVAFALIGVMVILVIKNVKPELVIPTSMFIGAVILVMAIVKLVPILNCLNELSAQAGMQGDQIKLILKIIGITYISEFGSEICKDAGEASIANKIDIAGKVAVLFISTPAIITVIELTTGLLK